MQVDSVELKTKVLEALRKLRNYQTPNHGKALVQALNSFGPFIALWIIMYNLWDVSKWAVIGLSFLNALFLVRIFIIQHDCGHNNFVRSSRIRHILGYICSLFSSIPYHYWAKSHHFHHMHNGILEFRDIGDIDTMTVKEFSSLDKKQRFWYRIYRSTIVMFVFVPLYYILIHNRLPLIKLAEFKRVKWSLWLNNLIFVGIITLMCLVLDWQKVIAVHFIILGFFSMIAIWFFYIQHQHEHGYKEWKNKWEFMIAAIKGSSYYKLPKWMNWFTGNIAIHHIHHLNPAIPNYHLQECVKEVPFLNSFTTEITFWESLKLSQNKLWHEAEQRMITLREYYQMERMGLV
ncbi:MAG: fatty acid desaturase [Bacteroidota bacterium]|nr:fatty acid desaturase [Bacteroidota bacterium]